MGGRHVRCSPVVKNVLVRGCLFTNVVKNIQVASIYPLSEDHYYVDSFFLGPNRDSPPHGRITGTKKYIIILLRHKTCPNASAVRYLFAHTKIFFSD